MTSPRPETIGAQLFTEAFGYLNQARTPTEFDMRRMARDADKLQGADASQAFAVRAALAAIRWDVGDLRTQVANYLHLDDSPIALSNVALIFRLMNDAEGSVDLARRAWIQAPKDDYICGAFLSCLVRAGRLHEAHRLGPSLVLSEPERELLATVDRTVTTLQQIAVTEQRLLDELAMALAVMTNRRIRNQRTHFGTQIDPESGQYSLLAMLSFVGNADDEEALAEDLATNLMELPDWNPTELAIRFEPMNFGDSDVMFAG